jgi:putative copper resistance protein D
MSPDLVSVTLRAASFVALFQAAGITCFVAMFDRHLVNTGIRIRHLGTATALAGIVLLLAHQLLEPSRLTGEFSSAFDGDLQRLAFSSTGGTTYFAQVFGLMLVALGLRRSDRRLVNASIGAMLAVLAFTMTGHTSVHALRWLLAPLLALHVSIVAFWFGAMAPLLIVSARETPGDTALILQRFSALAGWLVPGILVAGLAMTALLVPDISVLRRPYGQLLIVKLLGFALLIVLAAVNRWRLVPAITAGEPTAIAALRRSIAIEYALIVAVLSVTAALTTFYSYES